MSIEIKSGGGNTGSITFSSFGGTVTIDHVMSDTMSAGWIAGGTITDAGGGNIAIANVEGLLRSANDPEALLYYCKFSGIANIAIPAGAMRYIYAFYNAGNPIIQAIANPAPNNHEYFYIGQVHHVNIAGTNTLVIYNDPRPAGDFFNRGLTWASGLIKTKVESGDTFSDPIGSSRKIRVEPGKVYDRYFREFSTPLINTSGTDTVRGIYRNGTGGYTYTAPMADWPNTQYDNGSGTLVNMTAGYFANIWLLRGFNGEVRFMYGQNEYATQAAAENEIAPALPPEYQDHGYYIARITFQNGAATFASTKDVRPTFSTAVATLSVMPAHNDTTGKQGGSPGQYYHGTLDQSNAWLGTAGTPSNTNRFVTDADPRNTNARTPTVHASTHGFGGSDAITLAQSQVTNLVTDLAGKFSKAGDTLTGTMNANGQLITSPELKSYSESYIDHGNSGVGATITLDYTTGNTHKLTITGNTTINFTNWPVAGKAAGLTLVLVNGGSAAITWPVAVKWAGGTAPALSASGRDRIVFFTEDGGTTIDGIVTKGFV